MKQIKQDPEKLRAFAADVSTHSHHLLQTVDELSRHLSRLGQTWKDEQFDYFSQDVEVIKNSLVEFSEEVNKVVHELNTDAEKLDKYLSA